MVFEGLLDLHRADTCRGTDRDTQHGCSAPDRRVVHLDHGKIVEVPRGGV